MGKGVGEYIYSEGRTNSFSCYSQTEDIKENRLWSEGGQSMEDFRNDLDTGGNLSWLNLNLDVPTPMPQFLNKFIGTLTNRSYSIVVEATDNQSKSEKDEEYNNQRRKMKLAKHADKLSALGIGIDMENTPESRGRLRQGYGIEFQGSC